MCLDAPNSYTNGTIRCILYPQIQMYLNEHLQQASEIISVLVSYSQA